MSKYRKIAVEFKDEGALRAALQDVAEQVGIEFEEGQDVHLYGYQGDVRPETAQFVIRRQHVGGAANDVGFARQPDGSYVLIISDYDQSVLRNSHTFNMGNRRAILDGVKQRYAYHATMNAAIAQGYSVTETAMDDGTIRMQLVRAY